MQKKTQTLRLPPSAEVSELFQNLFATSGGATGSLIGALPSSSVSEDIDMRPCRPEPFCAVLNDHSLRIDPAWSDCPDDQAMSNMVLRSGLNDVDVLAMLNLLVWGVVITDAQGKPLLVNRTAGEIIAERDGLSIYSARLAAPRPCDPAAIRRLITAASGDVDGTDSPGTMSVSRPSMRGPLAIVVASLRTLQAWLADGRPSAIVFIRDPERAATVCPGLIQQLYSLTPAEAAVAVQIASGEGLLASCKKLQITEATAKTHLQRVFRKTGTRRHAQLTRLLIESSIGLRSQAARRSDEPPAYEARGISPGSRQHRLVQSDDAPCEAIRHPRSSGRIRGDR